MKDLVNETISRIVEYESKNYLFEMANIRTKISGIRPMLYATYDGEYRDDIPYWARIKVELTKKNNFHFILLDPVQIYNKHGEFDKLEKQDQKLVKEALPYIKKHKETFLAHWRGLIFDDQLYEILQNKISLEQAIDENKF